MVEVKIALSSPAGKMGSNYLWSFEFPYNGLRNLIKTFFKTYTKDFGQWADWPNKLWSTWCIFACTYHFVLLCPPCLSLVHAFTIINYFFQKAMHFRHSEGIHIFLGLGYDFGHKVSCIHSLFCIVLWFHKIFPKFFIKSKI